MRAQPPSLPCWTDGVLHLPGADGPPPTVSVLDAGLRSGWGVFETLRAHGRATLAADRHLSRLVEGAAGIGIDVTEATLADALAATLAAARDVHEVAVRITLTAGPVDDTSWPPVPSGHPTLVVTLHHAPPLHRPALDGRSVDARRWPAGLKATSYLPSVLASREARAAGADTAVLVDGTAVLETAEGNLLALVDDELCTPPTDGRILPGVTRALVLEAARTLGLGVREEPLDVAVLGRAEAVLVTAAVSGVRTLRSLDGRPLAGGTADAAAHPVVAALRDALDAARR